MLRYGHLLFRRQTLPQHKMVARMRRTGFPQWGKAGHMRNAATYRLNDNQGLPTNVFLGWLVVTALGFFSRSGLPAV